MKNAITAALTALFSRSFQVTRTFLLPSDYSGATAKALEAAEALIEVEALAPDPNHLELELCLS